METLFAYQDNRLFHSINIGDTRGINKILSKKNAILDLNVIVLLDDTRLFKKALTKRVNFDNPLQAVYTLIQSNEIPDVVDRSFAILNDRRCSEKNKKDIQKVLEHHFDHSFLPWDTEDEVQTFSDEDSEEEYVDADYYHYDF